MDEITNQAMLWKGIAGLLGVILPVLVLVVWKKKWNPNGSLRPAVVGAVTFIIFSQMLEGIPKYIFFNGSTALSQYVWSHAWAYVVTGCLLAGIFEEIGRYVAFRFFLTEHRKERDAITYGIGHGGIESVLVLGITAVSSIGMAIAIRNGSFAKLLPQMNAVQMRSLELQIAAISGYGALRMLLEVFERVVAMTLHVALSVVVLEAVKTKKKQYLLLAILLHAVFDVPAALYQCSVIPMWVAEILLGVAAIGNVVYAKYVYEKENRK